MFSRVRQSDEWISLPVSGANNCTRLADPGSEISLSGESKVSLDLMDQVGSKNLPSEA